MHAFWAIVGILALGCYVGCIFASCGQQARRYEVTVRRQHGRIKQEWRKLPPR